MSRIYGFSITSYPAEAYCEPETDGYCPLDEDWEPDGWAEYALEKWGSYPGGTHRPFFWPSQDKMFHSRSAAQSRVDIVKRWGGDAVLLEGSVSWQTVTEANALRKRRRDNARIEKLRAEIARIEAS